jgi:predicted MFS family arabinose efflux permease
VQQFPHCVHVKVSPSAYHGSTCTTFNFIFGVWLEDGFGMKAAGLGAAAAVIGIAELLGSSGAAGFADRIGKVRSVAAGLALNCAAALLLPVIAVNALGAQVGLFFFFISYEFVLVSSLPLMSEVLPSARATMMALTIAMFAGGRALGDLLSPWIYQFGIWGNVIVCAAFNVVALVFLRWVRPAAVVPAVIPSEENQ